MRISSLIRDRTFREENEDGFLERYSVSCHKVKTLDKRLKFLMGSNTDGAGSVAAHFLMFKTSCGILTPKTKYEPVNSTREHHNFGN